MKEEATELEYLRWFRSHYYYLYDYNYRWLDKRFEEESRKRIPAPWREIGDE